jgi:hypothetical protein
MYVDATIPATYTSVRVYCQVVDGNTGIFDLMYCSISPIKKYTIPTSMLKGPYRILIQDRLSEPDGHYRVLQVGERPRSGHVLRLIGKGQLSTLSADTSTVEIGEPQTQLLVAQALYILSRNLSMATTSEASLAALYGQHTAIWEREAEKLKASSGIALPGIPAENPRAWSIEEDSSGRYILFRW